jgi:diguanylate cyclase (GGDEF)-like protein
MSNSSAHILLVEDNIDQRELTIFALTEKDPDVLVTEAENGPSALDVLEKNAVDIVILDYNLPGMNGLETLRELRQLKPKVPVIMVTGQGDETVAVEAMKSGAHDYIIKMRNYHDALPVTIEKVIRQNRMKRELEEASLRSRRLYELSFCIAKEQKVDALTERLVEGAAELIGVEKSMLYLVDDQGQVIFAKSFGIEVAQDMFIGPLQKIGILSAAYIAKQPIVIHEPQEHPQWESGPWLHPIMRQMLSVPLAMQGEVEGALCLFNKTNHEPFSSEDVDTLSTLAVHAGVAIDNARFVEKMEQQAITDSLTGLSNHMEFQKRLGEEIDRGRRYHKEFSLLMFDLDHFKMVNDSYGHQMGDAVLKEMASVLKGCLRSVDLVFRYGGEEFAVILPETSEESAKIISECIRQTIADSSYGMGSNNSLMITVSIGLSSFPQDADQREELIATADQALFSAKRSGRNRVAVYRNVLDSLMDNSPVKLENYLRDSQMKMLKDLAEIVDAKSPYTKGHAEAVARYAMRFAEKLKLDEQEKKKLGFASLLHNIGVVGIPTKLLNKQGPLTQEEREIINSHPTLAQMLIKQTEQLASALPAILYHHERYDGHGYPNGIKGEEIPYLARVLSVVDAYNAMISARAYRPRLTKTEAIAELEKNAGTQFDPEVTAAFITFLEQEDPDKT